MIVIIDSGVANTGSIANMLKRIGAGCKVSSRKEDILSAARLILPGVGSFDAGMGSLAAAGLIDPIRQRVLEGQVPLLGVCLGMQLLSRRSEEGSLPGLGLIAADTVKWRFDPKTTGLKIPHMGWNTVVPENDSPLFKSALEISRYYFVHSYHVVCDDAADVAATVHHGYEAVAAVVRGNVMGVQFHPEKSHSFGMKLLEDYCNWNPAEVG